MNSKFAQELRNIFFLTDPKGAIMETRTSRPYFCLLPYYFGSIFYMYILVFLFLFIVFLLVILHAVIYYFDFTLFYWRNILTYLLRKVRKLVCKLVRKYVSQVLFQCLSPKYRTFCSTQDLNVVPFLVPTISDKTYWNWQK